MKAHLACTLVFFSVLLVLGALFVGGGSIPTYALTLTQFKTSAMGTVRQYFVPFDDAHLWQLFVGKDQCHYQNTGATPQQPLVSYIFLTAGSDNTVYYYDHWEDGYDIDPLDPGAMTEIGVLDAGVTKLFQSDIYTAQVGTTFYYDGRDRITLLGEDGAVVRMVYPKYAKASGGSGTSLAAAWEVPGVREWGTHYVATVGEDLDFNGPGIKADDHDYAGLEVMAEQPNTQVYYNNVLVATLGTGETFFIAGANDGSGGGGVDSDDVITATAPIQVQMMTGGCNYDYSAHGYTLQPVEVWAQEYWAPVPGFSVPCLDAGTEVDTDLNLHNPHSFAITVTVSSNMGNFDMAIPATTTLSVLHETGWTDISTGTHAVHLTSEDTFWGVAVVDSTSRGTGESNTYDWAYSLIPLSELSSQVVVGYAPGNGDPAPADNGNIAFVAAITDTVLYVDLTQDGLPDPFDINGDGDRDDYDQWIPAWDEPLSGMGIPIQAGQVIRVGDPNDQDLRGAIIYTKQLDEKIAVAWGQDPCRADGAAPYLDLGYTILPLPIADLSKWDELAEDADVSGDISPGDILTYTLLLRNRGMGSMNTLVLTDTLPYTYTDFVVDSLRVDVVDSKPLSYTVEYYNGVWQTSPLTDAQLFRVTYPTFGARDMMTLTFRVQLHTNIPLTVSQITNRAMIDAANIEPKLSEDPDDPTDPDTDTDIGHPNLVITKQTTLGSNIVKPGDHIPYTITVANIGSGTALNVVISDVLQTGDLHPPALRYVPGTLDITWPISKPKLVLETRVVSHTFSFKGYYADDFDDYVDGAPTTTLYAGDDGTLAWSTDWIEVNESDGPMSGDVQVGTTAGEALSNSDPAYLSLTDADGGNSGVRRQMDLEAFQEPLLRYYVFGDTDDAAEQYQVSANGAPLLTQWYNGAYRLEEVPLTLYRGLPLTLTLWAWPELESDDVYRFDNFAIYEAEPERSITTTLKKAYKVFSYTVYHGASPLAYDVNTGQMVITDGLRLPAGQVITITFQAQAAVPLSDSLALTNTACTAAENWPKGPVCAQAKSLSVRSRHQLTLAKRVTPPTVLSGDFLTYTLDYTATGDSPASGVVITDHLPVGVRFITATGGIAADYASMGGTTIVTWHLGTLLTATSGITLQHDAVTLVGQLNPAWASTWLTNVARLTSGGGVSATAMVTSRVEPSADLVLHKSSAPTPYVPGDRITYTLVVTNAGPFPLGAMTLTDNLPSPVETPRYAVSMGNYDPSTGRWEGGILMAGERVTLTIAGEVRADFVGQLINTAMVTPVGVLDPDVRNNRSTDVNPFTLIADLALLKSSIPDPYISGDRITYTLVVTNYGPSAIAAFTLTDNLPSPVETPRYAVSAGDYDPSTGRWGDSTLTAGERVTLTIAGEVKANFVGQLINTAVVTPIGVLDPDVQNNRSTYMNPRFLTADLAVAKHSAPCPYVSGARITYTLVVTNYGPSAVSALTLTDYLPASILTPTYYTAIGTYDSATGAWQGLYLNAGTHVTLTITGTVPQMFDGVLENIAQVATPQARDPNMTNNTAIDLNPGVPILEATKRDVLFTDVDNNGFPSPGDVLLYTITITNSGDISATGVSFSDMPDVNTILITNSVQTSRGRVLVGNGPGDAIVEVDLATLPGGGHNVAISFQVRVVDPLLEGVTEVANQGLVSSCELPVRLTDDPDTPQRGDSTKTPVMAAPKIETYKRDTLAIDADGNGVPSPGDTLRYEISIVNVGNQRATEVVFTDIIEDPGLTLIPGTVQTTAGVVISGNVQGDTGVVVVVGAMAGNGSTVEISFQAIIMTPLPAGIAQVANQGLVSSAELPFEPTDDPDTPDENDCTITPVVARPKIDAYKRDLLLADADHDGNFSPGDTLLYEIMVVNRGDQVATGVVFQDMPDEHTALVVGSVQASRGTVISGNQAGDLEVSIDIGTLPEIGEEVYITFQVVISKHFPADIIWVSNQGVIFSVEGPPVLTDDSDTPELDDPTRSLVVAEPELEAYKTAYLFADVDGNAAPSPGDTLVYRVTLVNMGNAAAEGVRLTDLMTDPYLSLVTGTVQVDQGTVVQGNHPGDTGLEILVGTLPGYGSSVVISFQASVVSPMPSDITRVANQGVLSGLNVGAEPTDDPSSDEDDDPTYVLITRPVCHVEPDVYEADGFYDKAAEIETDGSALTHTFHIVNDEDWMKFYAWAERVYTMTTLNLDADVDTVLRLYDVDGRTLLARNDNYLLGHKASQVTWQAPENGWYYVQVIHSDPLYNPGNSYICGNHYQVALDVLPCEVTQDVYEPDDVYANALLIPTDGTVRMRSFEVIADKDWMRFEALAGHVYTITTSRLGAAVDTVLSLYAKDGSTLLAENDDAAPDADVDNPNASRIVWTAPESGVYFVRVTHFDPAYDPHTAPICGNEYSIAVKTLLCSLVDSYEPDGPRRAITIPINAGVLTRTFNMVADKDWGRFYAYAGQTYTITTSRLDMDVDTVLQLYDTDGRRLLAENDDYTDQSLGASRIVWTAPTNGWYFVRTTHFDPTYDPRYAVTCGGRYAVSVAQDVLGIEKFVAHQGAARQPQLAPDPMPPANFYISGDVITYTIAVWNKTDAPQTGLVITDYIPAHTSYVAGSESLATSNEAILGEISGPDPLVVRVGELTPRARITFTFQVLIDQNVVGRKIINQGEVRSDQQSEPLYTSPVITPVYSRLYIPIIIKTPRTRALK
jgi:uncharacterized repeat protein (TIGR01451 family)